MASNIPVPGNNHTHVANIDMLKAFGIFIVCLGHMTNNSIITKYIYSFHVPLFFWISGYLFTPNKYSDFSSFIRRRLKTLVIPYFVFASLSYFFWLFVVRGLSVRGRVHELNTWDPFWGLLNGIGVEPWRNPLDVALWFLPCLFATEVIFWLIYKCDAEKRNLIATLCALGLLGYCAGVFLPFRLPWSIDVAITAAVFYGIGYHFRNNGEMAMKSILSGPLVRILCIIAIGLLGLTLSAINGKADMNYNQYGNPFLFYIAAISGIYFWYYLFLVIPSGRIISYIGRNTIIIVGMSGLSFFFISGCEYLILGKLSDSSGKMGIAVAVIYTVLNIVLLVPVMYLMNRFTPFVLGRSRKTLL